MFQYIPLKCSGVKWKYPSIANLHVVIVLHFLNDHDPYTVYSVCKIFIFILLAYKGAPSVTTEFNQRI